MRTAQSMLTALTEHRQSLLGADLPHPTTDDTLSAALENYIEALRQRMKRAGLSQSPKSIRRRNADAFEGPPIQLGPRVD